MATETIPVAPAEAPSDELDLVARAQSGDRAAFSVLIRRYEGKIFRLAMNITQNREDAEDVLQEAFLKAYEHLDQFQGNSKFYTWIVRIAVNQALMKLRKRKSDRTVSLDEQIDTGEDTVVREIAAWDPDPEQRFSREELHSILTEAIDELAADLPHGFHAARRGWALDRRDSRSARPVRAGGEEPPAAGAPAAARQTHAFLQTQRRRRLCLHVRNFWRSSATIWTRRPDAETAGQARAAHHGMPELLGGLRYHQERPSRFIRAWRAAPFPRMCIRA